MYILLNTVTTGQVIALGESEAHTHQQEKEYHGVRQQKLIDSDNAGSDRFLHHGT